MTCKVAEVARPALKVLRDNPISPRVQHRCLRGRRDHVTLFSLMRHSCMDNKARVQDNTTQHAKLGEITTSYLVAETVTLEPWGMVLSPLPPSSSFWGRLDPEWVSCSGPPIKLPSPGSTPPLDQVSLPNSFPAQPLVLSPLPKVTPIHSLFHSERLQDVKRNLNQLHLARLFHLPHKLLLQHLPQWHANSTHILLSRPAPELSFEPAVPVPARQFEVASCHS